MKPPNLQSPIYSICLLLWLPQGKQAESLS